MIMPNLAVVVLLALVAGAAIVGGVELTHVAAGGGGDLTGRETLQRMVLRSKARAARVLRRGASAPVSPGPPTAHDDPRTEYLVRFGIGTPPQPVQLTFDTGSDLTWTQCRPCQACFEQALPHFDRSGSSTFQGFLPCESAECRGLELSSCGARSWGNGTCVYTYFYADDSLTNGLLAVDTFSFAGGRRRGSSTSVPSLSFGCGFFNSGKFKNNETGIAGFGRGPLSLPSQLKLHNFSHCFTAQTATGSKKPSSLLFDLPANLYRGAAPGAAVQTTPLVQNPANPSLYYLSLKGITVGNTRLPVPESTFALTSNGTAGGTFIDSGTPLTTLPVEVFRLLGDAFVSQVKPPAAAATAANFSTEGVICFEELPGAKVELPKLVFHLEGATLDLPRDNYVMEIQEAGHRHVCIALVGGDKTVIIGNFQQQNLHVLYDIANNKLSFVHAQCDML